MCEGSHPTVPLNITLHTQMIQYTKLVVILAITLASPLASAQDFTYQPQNPAFGGSYLNYSWLLSSAQAQNGFTEEQEDFSSRFDRDPLEDFQKTLNRQILSQITRQITSDQFGEGGLQEGQYEIGNYQIDVAPGSDAIQITILDTSSGSQTTVSVPYF